MPTNAFNFGPVLDQTLANTQTILSKLAQMEQKMAEDYTGLNQKLTDLHAEVADIGTRMDKLFADLNAALGSGNQAAVDAASAAIQSEIDALKAVGDRNTSPAPPPGG